MLLLWHKIKCAKLVLQEVANSETYNLRAVRVYALIY